MSHLLHRRRGHDSENEDEEESIVSGMTTTDYDEDDDYTTSDEDDSSQEEETDSEYDSDEQDTDAALEQEDGVEQQSAGMETSTKAIQQTATTSPPQSTSNQTAEIKEQVNGQPKPPLAAPPALTTATTQTVDMDYQDLQQQEKEKTVQELREYRRKLAEDPSFVPYVGLFWGHDDRYREDSLATTSNSHEATRESVPHFSQHTATPSIKKPSLYDRQLDPLMHKKWDHSGYEELLRLEEQDERRKRELIESGEPPSQVADQHHRPLPPRLPRYHHYNSNSNGGRGRGGGSYRGGYHHQHNRSGNSQKRPFTQQQQQQQEWPQLATTTTTAAGGDTANESTSDNNKTQELKVDAWGSVDRAQEIKPIVNMDPAADGWGTPTTTNVNTVDDGWGTPTTTVNAADDGWGPAPPTEAPKTQLVDTTQGTPKQDSTKTRTVQAEHGWGALPESTGVSTSTMAESKQQGPESSTAANKSSQDNWNASPPTTDGAESNSSTGWGEQPVVVAARYDGWNTEAESKDGSVWTHTDTTSRMEAPITTSAQKATDYREVDTWEQAACAMPTAPSFVATTTTTDGWGKPKEAPVQDTWSNNGTKDWNASQSDANKANVDSSSSNHVKGKGKWTSLTQKENHSDIPPEEKASSSWANVKLDVQVHTTPSDFTKIDYSNSRRYDSPGRINGRTPQQQQHPQTTLDESSVQQQQQQQECDSEATSDNWGVNAEAAIPHAEWSTLEKANVDTNVQSEWTTATPPKSEETAEGKLSMGHINVMTCAKVMLYTVDASWDSKPAAKATASWNTATEATYSKPTSNWNESSAATTTFDQSNSSSSSVRGGGWNHSRSSKSANWNADREWNNKMRQQQQSKKSRGYFSGKNTATTSTDIHAAAETASNSTEGFNTPETSAWGHFQSTGDDDSDVEIILEAEEEPEWSKDDEQVLGMTAPADTQHQQPYSPPSSNRLTKSYLSQHQHDSGQSSPRPEYNRKPAGATVNDGRHGNNNNKPSHPHRTSQYDDHWRQPREEADAYRPMYYPTPVAHHRPSYMPMIPNGNGTPMYAMPFPMGPNSSSSSSPSNMAARGGGSASPLHEPSSSTSPPKFYTPSPPNVQQLPPGYEANGMVYYGMDPSAMYPPPQAFYYYAPPPPPQSQQPPHMMANNTNDGYDAMEQSSISPLHQHQHLQQAEEDGWGPTPDTVETENQWRTTTTNKSSQHDFQNRKQQQPVNQYYYPQHNHRY
ncbi:hypothetical protein MAM1_0023d01941 [Mucor ambiguus]|uniref:Btz domain-containing protein n=1 Tax=Mucor ambiguus TaxID=91626 RepID=A0A0C9MH91_9FUNG|nr:hypothetical protein MAM1_0023d01941 [Mucor ambiguus]